MSNAVTDIAKKLRFPNLPREVVKATEAALRVFKLHRPGRIAKGDNEMKRAAALMEYVARERFEMHIPMKDLAKAVCTKQDQFEKFHDLVGNSKTTEPTTRKTRSTNPAKHQPRLSSIPALSIKLARFVKDSEGICKRAEDLYNQLVKYSSLPENRDQRNDMQAHPAAYEAACYFVEATKGIATSSSLSKGRPPVRVNDERTLTITDVVNVSSAFTSLQLSVITDHVRQIASDAKSTKSTARKRILHKDQNRQGTKKRRMSTKAPSKQDARNVLPLLDEESTTPEKENHTAAVYMDSSQTQHCATNHADTDSAATNGVKHSLKFLVWKEKVLSHSTTNMIQQIQAESKGAETTPLKISREVALERASRMILISKGRLATGSR